MELKDAIIAARKERGWTQEQAADACGISRSMYCLIEIGKRNPSFDAAKQIADAMGISIEYTLGGK